MWYEVDRVLDIVKGKGWTWSKNNRCKYITLRIDTRDMCCTIADRDGNNIDLEGLQRQYKAGDK